MKILIVEDDELSQRILGIMLEPQGHVVIPAMDGQEALELIRKEPFDLVLLDLHLPRMSGIEICKHIRASENGSTHLPVIALTASVEDVDMKEYYEAGIDDYIAKPCKDNQIRQVLEAAAGGLYQRKGSTQAKQAVQVDPACARIVLDVEKGLALFDQDAPAYKSLLMEFTASLPQRLAALQADLAKEQWKEMAIHAHNLKGISAYFGANLLSQLALRLEGECHQAEHRKARKTIRSIRWNIWRLKIKAARL